MSTESIQPSHTLSSPSPPDFNISQHQGLFQWVSSLHQVAKEMEFQHQSFQQQKGLSTYAHTNYKMTNNGNVPGYAAAAAESLQSCPALCDPIDSSPSGSPIPEILQARTLQWVAISFPTAWKWKVKVKLLSPVRLLATPWTAAYQAPPSMEFSRQEYWSWVPLPSPNVPGYSGI